MNRKQLYSGPTLYNINNNFFTIDLNFHMIIQSTKMRVAWVPDPDSLIQGGCKMFQLFNIQLRASR